MVGKSLGTVGPNEKLREARQERGWRLKDVVAAVQSVEGRSLGLDENTVSRWERGVVEPTDFYKARLCLAFDVQHPGELAWYASPRLLAEMDDVRRRIDPSTAITGAIYPNQSETDGTLKPDGTSDRHLERLLTLAQSRWATIAGRVPAQPADRSATLLMFDSARPQIWLAVAQARALGDSSREVALVSALWPYWSIRALLADARFAIQTALRRVHSHDRHEAVLLNADGEIARYQGATVDAINSFTDSYELSLALADREREAEALNNRGNAYMDLGDLDRAERDYRASLERRAEAKLVLGAAYCEAGLAYALTLKEQPQEAQRLADGALRSFEAYGYEPGVADASIPLALAMARLGAPEVARRQLRRSIAITSRLGYPWNTVQALEGMAIVEAEAGLKDQAANFLRAATDLRLQMGSRRPVLWQALLDAREISDDTAAEESLFGAYPPGR